MKENYNKDWVYIKYQLVTKGILFFVLYPFFAFGLEKILAASGKGVISSGDYLSFLLSFDGIVFFFFLMIILAIIIALDINGMIYISALLQEKKKDLSPFTMVKVGLASLRFFAKPKGILLFLYVALIIPLVSIGVTITPMKNFQIPNFITSVIWSNKSYTILYVLLLTFLGILTFRYLFTFHYIILEERTLKDGLKSSKELMKKHALPFLYQGMMITLRRGLILFLSLGIITFFVLLPKFFFSFTQNGQRGWSIFFLLFLGQWIAFVFFMSVPITIDTTTKLFYHFRQIDNDPVFFQKKEVIFQGESRNIPRYWRKLFLGILLIHNLFVTFYCVSHFEKLFYPKKNMVIIAHRGGGDLDAENSLDGLKKAIENGISWSEFDVQRTKDHQYVINHDKNFKRLCGEKRASYEMNLQEIQSLSIKNTFHPKKASQPVATLEEFLDTGKDQIGLFIELKGKTADKTMVNDVVSMVQKRDMENQVALLSLDYSLIQYIKSKYPHMKTGYLYFFSLGDIKKMKGDILIMEEGEATKKKIKAIHKENKQAIVWTVNKKASIKRFLYSDVDGIITDTIFRVQEVYEEEKKKSDLEYIFQKFLPMFTIERGTL